MKIRTGVFLMLTALLIGSAQAQTDPAGGFSSPVYVPPCAPGEPFSTYFTYAPGDPTALPLPVTARFRSSVNGIWTPVEIVSAVHTDLSFIGSIQVILLIPVSAPVGIADIELTMGDVIQTQSLQVIEFRYAPQMRPGITEAALAQQYSPRRGLSDNKMTNPAQAGDRITLWGVGLGARPMDRKIELSLGGVAVPIRWMERSSDGHDRLEFTLPVDDVPLDCYVPLELQVNHVPFFAGVISISAGPGPCGHPLGLSSADLATLDAGGYVSLVTIGGSGNLYVSASGYSRSETFAASSRPVSATEVWYRSGSTTQSTRIGAIGSCRVVVYAATSGISGVGTGFGGGPDPRNAILYGPSSTQISLHELVPGLFQYSSTPEESVAWENLGPEQLVTGAWSIDLPAESQYPAATVPFQIPRQIELTEAIQIPSLTRDFRVRWNGSAFRAGNVLAVEFSAGTGVGLVCSTPAAAGEMTVKAENLAWVWDSPYAVALISATVDGARQPFQIQQAGVPARLGVFDWSQAISVILKSPVP